MFRLEKVFQNDDSGFIFFTSFIKAILLAVIIYSFTILNENTIYDLFDFEIFKKSEFFFYNIFISTSYLIISLFIKNRLEYQKNFLSFLKEDILNLIISNIITFSLFFILKIDFKFTENFIYLTVILLICFCILKIYFNYLYQSLINNNVIQKNVMIVGSYNEIKKILNENFNKIFVFKCCLITDLNKQNIKLLKSEIKFPIFNENEDIRSILEYHSLGQIWILNGEDKKKEIIFGKILKFSVDTLNVRLDKKLNLKGKKLLANKYDFEFYELSRFYGISLFFKILIDKLFSIFFLIFSSPLLIISSIAILIEDGFPLLFTQNRTGWDGRRFKIYKLRSLKKTNFDKTKQVTQGDERLLKIGKIIRRYSIDELPQFLNVIKGDMSIVGPRPHMVEHDIHYSNLFNNFLKRHKCNPGLTGWAQVNGLRGATPKPEIMKRRMEFDLWYLNNWTIFLDIYIIFKTFYALLKYKGD